MDYLLVGDVGLGELPTLLLVSEGHQRLINKGGREKEKEVPPTTGFPPPQPLPAPWPPSFEVMQFQREEIVQEMQVVAMFSVWKKGMGTHLCLGKEPRVNTCYSTFPEVFSLGTTLE